jgi:hypothetical protein
MRRSCSPEVDRSTPEAIFLDIAKMMREAIRLERRPAFLLAAAATCYNEVHFYRARPQPVP